MYYDVDGNKCSLVELCRREPEWAAERIGQLQSSLCDAKNELETLSKRYLSLKEAISSLQQAERFYTEKISKMKKEVESLKNQRVYDCAALGCDRNE